jgi:chemotaxis response regulator CheB
VLALSRGSDPEIRSSPLVSAGADGYDEGVNPDLQRARALCVGRHPFLSDHIARYFASLGVETRHAVGLDNALAESRSFAPDVVIAEYELLAMLSLDAWERDELLSRTAVIAVSLTRRPQEAQLLDISGIAGFLYLPHLDADTATRLVGAAASSSRARYTPSFPRPVEAAVTA